MKNCLALPDHPFKNAPGTSQRHRALPALSPDSAPIDGSTLAERLIFIADFAKQINFYQPDPERPVLTIDSWQRFFTDSPPFVLARLIKTSTDNLKNTLTSLATSVENQPAPETLRLLRDFVVSDLYYTLNDSFYILQGQPNALITLWDNAIRTELSASLVNLILQSRRFYKKSGLSMPDFQRFIDTDSWGIDLPDLYVQANGSDDALDADELYRMIALEFYREGVAALGVLHRIVAEAPAFLPETLYPAAEAYQQNHPPHLGLMFAFLQLFELFGQDLNGLGKAHLEYFFETVLHLSPRKPRPDAAHLVFEVQQHLDRYRVSKGVAVKDGKDAQGTEIDFTLDEEIVVDKAKVEQLLSLFRQTVDTAVCDEKKGMLINSATEGLYIATKADSADGKGEGFAESQGKNWATLGSKKSKFTPKGKTEVQNHPSARMGFVLASPVLFLQEGSRKITFTLSCTYHGEKKIYNELAQVLNTQEQQHIGQVFHVITEEGLKLAQQEGLSPEGLQRVRGWLEHKNPYTTWSASEPCILPVNQCAQTGAANSADDCDKVCVPDINDEQIQYWKPVETLLDCLKKKDSVLTDYTILEKISRRTALKLSLSGEKEWVEVDLNPLSTDHFSDNYKISLIALDDNIKEFTLKIETTLSPKQPAITFYNKQNLKEDLGTDLPVAKFEVDPDLKIWCPNATGDPACCFEKSASEAGAYVSLWDFFSHTQITSADIKVEVCGVRNLVVQNDENVQDINSPIFPFGTRPEVPGFSVVEDPALGLDSNSQQVIQGKKRGPEFYIGSREIFLKKWDKAYVNLEWKDKPLSFNSHYAAYKKNGINEDDFKIEIGALENGVWNVIQTGKELFGDDGDAPFCPDTAESIQTISINNSVIIPSFKQEIAHPLSPLNVHTRNGFIKMKLSNQDFLHRDYPFVLARQMLAFGKYPNVKEVPGVVLKFDGDAPKSYEELLGEAVAGALERIRGAAYPFPILPPFFPLPDPTTHQLYTDEAVWRSNNGIDDLVNSIHQLIQSISTDIQHLQDDAVLNNAQDVTDLINYINTRIGAIQAIIVAFDPIVNPTINSALYIVALDNCIDELESIRNNLQNVINTKISALLGPLGQLLNPAQAISMPAMSDRLAALATFLRDKLIEGEENKNGGVPIPFEPYTPTLKYISLDYTATAETQDINFTHLHPYPDTFKQEAFSNEPLLVATPPAAAISLGDDMNVPAEGTLYIGLKNLTPGSNLNLLFQLAEATADSETEKARVAWQYLGNNEWRDLREGFEILDDATKGLTASGIIKIAIPPDITNGPENTLLPRGLHWIKVAAPAYTRAVCETIGVHAQAVKATFAITPKSAPARSATPLPAGSLAKLRVADANVKKVEQPYESFGGRAAEDTGTSKATFYQRAAEHLRHKGRAINSFDYERIVLDAFPEVYKVKCIPHDMALGAARHGQDLEWAPGFVTLVVIPDLVRLKAGENITPRVPISLLESIEEEVCRRSSPFARIRVFNPRYEGIHVNIEVVLVKNLDQKYYEAELQKDIAHFLAPWYLGDNEKLRFGQAVYYSDLLKFVESLPYVDFVTQLRMSHESIGLPNEAIFQSIIEPLTARSILTAGIITVCPGSKPDCPPVMLPNPCLDLNTNKENDDGRGEPFLA